MTDQPRLTHEDLRGSSARRRREATVRTLFLAALLLFVLTFLVNTVAELVRQRLRELAHARIAYGYRRLHTLLRREGWPVDHKRVLRLYREEGLTQQRKRPKRRRSPMRRSARWASATS